MTTEPTPPDALPDSVVAELQRLDDALLRAASDYAARLAEADRRDDESDDDEDDDQFDEEDLPDDVDVSEAPSGATLTIKEINDNRYYYWQWRDGDKVKSKYVRPVNPDNDGANTS